MQKCTSYGLKVALPILFGKKGEIMKTFDLFAIRSKISKDYFVFEKMCDDGYGAYRDTICDNDIKDGELPTLFSKKMALLLINEMKCLFDNHDQKHLEIVSFQILVGEPD
jgi:hypothetical protein